MNRVSAIRLTVIAIVCLCVLAGAAEPYAVTYQRGVAVKMRDGVILRADIYRPDKEGKFPVLLQRTPYNKGSGGDESGQGWARRADTWW